MRGGREVKRVLWSSRQAWAVEHGELWEDAGDEGCEESEEAKDEDEDDEDDDDFVIRPDPSWKSRHRDDGS